MSKEDMSVLILILAMCTIPFVVWLLPKSDTKKNKSKHRLAALIMVTYCFGVGIILMAAMVVFGHAENNLSLFDWITVLFFFSLFVYIRWRSSKNDSVPTPKWQISNVSNTELKRRKAKLMNKLEKTLVAIDYEKGDYHNDWSMVETWKKHAKIFMESYEPEALTDEVYAVLNKLLDTGLQDVKAGKNPYDSDYLRLKDLKYLEETIKDLDRLENFFHKKTIKK